jgi:hypothetical protein
MTSLCLARLGSLAVSSRSISRATTWWARCMARAAWMHGQRSLWRLCLCAPPQGSGLRWAIAGRNNAKLVEVREGLTKINPKCEVRARVWCPGGETQGQGQVRRCCHASAAPCPPPTTRPATTHSWCGDFRLPCASDVRAETTCVRHTHAHTAHISDASRGGSLEPSDPIWRRTSRVTRFLHH